jgi:hypothetical protein
MDSEAKIILAFLFNRSGKTTLTEAELYLPLSMELGWFSTKEAQEFIAYAMKQKLLMKEGKLLHPNFPVDRITIPVGFTPSKKAFEEKKAETKEQTLIDSLVSQICEKTQRDQKDIEKEIQHEAKEKNIFPAVAALLVARRHEVNIAEWLGAVEMELFKENTG